MGSGSLLHRLLIAALGAALPVLITAGCSDGDVRDQNFGTDVGAGYVPPDGGASRPDVADVRGLDGATESARDAGADNGDGSRSDTAADIDNGG